MKRSAHRILTTRAGGLRFTACYGSSDSLAPGTEVGSGGGRVWALLDTLTEKCYPRRQNIGGSHSARDR